LKKKNLNKGQLFPLLNLWNICSISYSCDRASLHWFSYLTLSSTHKPSFLIKLFWFHYILLSLETRLSGFILRTKFVLTMFLSY